MPRKCTVCTHPQKEAIDKALVAGKPNRRISSQYSLSEASVRRHKKAHLPAKLAKAEEAQEVTRADDLLEQLDTLQRATRAILGRALQAGDLRTALSAIREARGNLDLLARLIGELKTGATVNILVTAEWISLRGTLLQALAPYPEARRAVALALEEAESSASEQPEIHS